MAAVRAARMETTQSQSRRLVEAARSATGTAHNDGTGGGLTHVRIVARGDGMVAPGSPRYSTVTDFARLRGLSTSVPRITAVW